MRDASTPDRAQACEVQVYQETGEHEYDTEELIDFLNCEDPKRQGISGKTRVFELGCFSVEKEEGSDEVEVDLVPGY